MAIEEKLGAAKRFGSRYGKRVKERFAKVEKLQREKKRCPYCNRNAVRREAVGIWQCKKCDAKFTGKAYDITKKIVLKEKVTELKKMDEPTNKIENKKTDEHEKAVKQPVEEVKEDGQL